MGFELKETGYSRKKNKEEMPYRIWKVWYWDENDKRGSMFIKQKELEDVIKFCKAKGMKKYSIFDDKDKNISNDGTLSMW